MRTFENFPEESECPICGTNVDKPCFLLPIAGTIKDRICQAQPTHKDCFTGRANDFVWYKDANIIALNLGE